MIKIYLASLTGKMAQTEENTYNKSRFSPADQALVLVDIDLHVAPYQFP